MTTQRRRTPSSGRVKVTATPSKAPAVEDNTKPDETMNISPSGPGTDATYTNGIADDSPDAKEGAQMVADASANTDPNAYPYDKDSSGDDDDEPVSVAAPKSPNPFGKAQPPKGYLLMPGEKVKASWFKKSEGSDDVIELKDFVYSVVYPQGNRTPSFIQVGIPGQQYTKDGVSQIQNGQ